MNRLKGYLENYNYNYFYTNVYGVSRSLLAIATLSVLLFNRPEYLFRESALSQTFPSCVSSNSISLYCIVPPTYEYIQFGMIISIIILLIVISGWRPRITGILHWWVTYSLASSATVIEGGEQVAQVLTFLLIPITLADNRKWHWGKGVSNTNVYMSYTALASYFVIRVQVAIIYLNATVAKISEPWLNGTALYYFFNDNLFSLNSFWGPIIYPILSTSIVAIITWGILLIELFIFLGLFATSRYKPYILIAGLLLHTGIALLMGLNSFAIIMYAALILFLRPFRDTFNLLFFKKINKKFNSQDLKQSAVLNK